MANVMFKKGLLANLPSTHSEGTFYVTTDERAIYLDISNEARIRLGDFQEFATLTALKANSNPSTSALYYIADVNCLAKWNGTDYVQINLDTGATSVEVVGDGNAVTAASYDAATRKLTLTMGETFATPAVVDEKVNAKAGELVIGEQTYNTVKEYVDAKTANIASDAALTELEGRVAGAEGEIDALQEQVGTGTVGEQIDAKITALKLAETYEPIGTGATEAGKVQAKLDEEVSRAKDAEEANAAAAKAADDKAVSAQADVDALEAKVGEVPADKTVVQMISDAQTAATYDDTEVRGLIQGNTEAIEILNGSETQAGSVKKTVADEIAKVVNGAPEDFDTLKEMSDWIASHKDDATAMNSAITALENILDGIGDTANGEQATVVAYVTEAIAALKIGDYAKAADLTAAIERIADLETDTHTHDNKTVIDGITAEKVTAWDAAEQNAKNYADGLAGNYDAAGSAADALADAKEYADGLAGNYEVAGAASTAETNAKAYADGLASNYDAAGSASTAEQNAKDYADSLVTTWGSF